jgi:hypothetical protein
VFVLFSSPGPSPFISSHPRSHDTTPGAALHGGCRTSFQVQTFLLLHHHASLHVPAWPSCPPPQSALEFAGATTYQQRVHPQRNTGLVDPTSFLFMKRRPMKHPLSKDVDVVLPLPRVFESNQLSSQGQQGVGGMALRGQAQVGCATGSVQPLDRP